MNRTTSVVLVALATFPLFAAGLAHAEPDATPARAFARCAPPLADGVELGFAGSRGHGAKHGKHAAKHGAKHGGGLTFVYDDNEDGTLSESEQKSQDADLQKGCSARNTRLLQEFDADRDGLLQQAEWDGAHAAMKQRHHGRGPGAKDGRSVDAQADRGARHAARQAALTAAVAELQGAFDDDGDGTLSASERTSLRASLRALVQAGEPLPVPPHALRDLLALTSAPATTTAP